MDRKGIEFSVGVFVLFGLAAASGLILFLGRNAASFGDSYNITVAFPSADGIIQNAQVLLSGVSIGRVATDPIVGPDGHTAQVTLEIDSQHKIREEAEFLIKSSGLLGDRYIDVSPGPEGAPPIAPGAVVPGTRSRDLSDLTQLADELKPVLRNAGDALDGIKRVVGDVETGVLTEQTQTNLVAAVDHFRDILRKLDEETLTPGTTTDLKTSIANLRAATDRLNSVLETLQSAAGTFKEVATSAKQVTARANTIMARIESGQGLLGRLINDRQMADNFEAFSESIRQRGVLFYKDISEEGGEDDSGSASQRPGRGSR